MTSAVPLVVPRAKASAIAKAPKLVPLTIEDRVEIQQNHLRLTESGYGSVRSTSALISALSVIEDPYLWLHYTVIDAYWDRPPITIEHGTGVVELRCAASGCPTRKRFNYVVSLDCRFICSHHTKRRGWLEICAVLGRDPKRKPPRRIRPVWDDANAPDGTEHIPKPRYWSPVDEWHQILKFDRICDHGILGEKQNRAIARDLGTSRAPLLSKDDFGQERNRRFGIEYRSPSVKRLERAPSRKSFAEYWYERAGRGGLRLVNDPIEDCFQIECTGRTILLNLNNPASRQLIRMFDDLYGSGSPQWEDAIDSEVEAMRKADERVLLSINRGDADFSRWELDDLLRVWRERKPCLVVTGVRKLRVIHLDLNLWRPGSYTSVSEGLGMSPRQQAIYELAEAALEDEFKRRINRSTAEAPGKDKKKAFTEAIRINLFSRAYIVDPQPDSGAEQEIAEAIISKDPDGKAHEINVIREFYTVRVRHSPIVEDADGTDFGGDNTTRRKSLGDSL